MEIKDTPSQKNRMLIDVGAGIFHERYLWNALRWNNEICIQQCIWSEEEILEN